MSRDLCSGSEWEELFIVDLRAFLPSGVIWFQDDAVVIETETTTVNIHEPYGEDTGPILDAVLPLLGI